MSLDGVLGFRLMKEGIFSLFCMLAVYRRDNVWVEIFEVVGCD